MPALNLAYSKAYSAVDLVSCKMALSVYADDLLEGCDLPDGFEQLKQASQTASFED